MPGFDVQTFSDACRDLFAPGLTLANFTSRGFAFLHRIVPAEFIACGILDSSRQRLTIGFDTPHSGFPPAITAFGALMGKYSLFNFDPGVRNGRPFCRSHFFSHHQFTNLDIYWEVFRPLGIDNHCAVHLPTQPGEIMFFGLERASGPDFSSEELTHLELAQAQLTNAHALARTFQARGDDTVEPALLTRAGLTPREAEVLSWLNEGKSNHEIAMLLGIGLYTVKAHLASIFDKTGTSNRLAAIVWARETCRRFRQNAPPPAGFVTVAARAA